RRGRAASVAQRRLSDLRVRPRPGRRDRGPAHGVGRSRPGGRLPRPGGDRPDGRRAKALESRAMDDCLFCKIIARTIPASIVYEDDRVLAFNDVNPQAPTHVLVVPKRHVASLDALSAGDDQIVGEVVRRAAAIAQERGIAAGGYRTVFNTNRD